MIQSPISLFFQFFNLYIKATCISRPNLWVTFDGRYIQAWPLIFWNLSKPIFFNVKT